MIAVGICACCVLAAGEVGPVDRLDPAWVGEVLLGREHEAPTGVVIRWTHTVRYLAVAPDARARAALRAAAGQIAAALEGLCPVELEFVAATDPRIGGSGYVTVAMVAPRDAAAEARRHGLLLPQVDADGWFTLEWEGDGVARRGFVCIDPGLDDAWLQHTTLEELFQVLGPVNDSARCPESVVFEGEGTYGRRTRLGDADVQLLRLCYGALPPGSDARAIARELYRRGVR